MYEKFHNQKRSIIDKLTEFKDIDYVLYGSPVRRKDTLCLNFINLEDITEKSFCTQSEYPITGSDSFSKLDSAECSTVCSFTKNKAMTGMEDQFKSILKNEDKREEIPVYSIQPVRCTCENFDYQVYDPVISTRRIKV